MNAVKFSKKQLKPLMDKFGIDENNETFKAVIELFDNQTDYQIWSLKAIFTSATTFTDVRTFKQWADENQPMIKLLSKGNLVAYKTSTDFNMLKTEMNGLTKYKVVNESINNFNTTQRHMLRENLLPNTDENINAFALGQSPILNEWYEVFVKFNRLPINRKKKFWSTSSAVYDLNTLKQLIKDCLAQSYEWNKEDLLQFVANNTPDCEIVWNEGDIVILDVPSFKSSKLLCGNGRTGWCLTREDSYFKRYVTNIQGNHQYFFFDFSRKEKDELAHIGFTVNPKDGITNAHSTSNENMISGIHINGKNIKISDALSMAKVSPQAYIRLNKLVNFRWNIVEVMDMIRANSDKFALSIDKEGILVIRVLSNEGVKKILSHTRIPLNTFNVNYDSSSLYIAINLNRPYTDKESLVAINIVKDDFGIGSVKTMLNPYNETITSTKFLEDCFGIRVSDFYQREKVDPKIMFHKLILEGSEDEAIELLKANPDMDVNFEFNYNAPIFNVIEKNMLKLFECLINHPKFNTSLVDGFGSTILNKLMYDVSDPKLSKEQQNKIHTMIQLILDSNKFDLNQQDINEDTAVNIAANSPITYNILRELVMNENVDINVVNDFNCTALGNAIRFQNVEAIKLLATRPDFKVREEDNILAKHFNIDLKAILSTVTEKIDFNKDNSATNELADVLSKVFASKRK